MNGNSNIYLQLQGCQMSHAALGLQSRSSQFTPMGIWVLEYIAWQPWETSCLSSFSNHANPWNLDVRSLNTELQMNKLECGLKTPLPYWWTLLWDEPGYISEKSTEQDKDEILQKQVRSMGTSSMESMMSPNDMQQITSFIPQDNAQESNNWWNNFQGVVPPCKLSMILEFLIRNHFKQLFRADEAECEYNPFKKNALTDNFNTLLPILTPKSNNVGYPTTLDHPIRSIDSVN